MDGISVTVNALPEHDERIVAQDVPALMDLTIPISNGVTPVHARDEIEQMKLGLDGSSTKSSKDGSSSKPKRPGLHREKSVPVPQQAPLPAPPLPSQDAENPTDSLSLMQLKKLVGDMPKAEQASYAFTYEDTTSFEEEVEELFSYEEEEQSCLLQARSTFDQLWLEHAVTSERLTEQKIPGWVTADSDIKTRFLKVLKSEIASNGAYFALMALVYLALGCWYDTASEQSRTVKHSATSEQDTFAAAEKRRFQRASAQVSCMQQNIRLIADVVGPHAIFTALRDACLDDFDDIDYDSTNRECNGKNSLVRWAALVLLCLLIDTAKLEPGNNMLREQILQLDPDLLIFLTKLLSDLRWSDTNAIPPTKVLLLYWKVILLNFGGTVQMAKIKAALSSNSEQLKKDGGPTQITASPLDYHVFRQEITSKYPAFKPPPPLFPFSPGYDSMLPPMDERFHRFSSAEEEHAFRGPASVGGRGSSIISQPVHIATPAPSPPPSPAGPGGKGVKKQNYQTNQMFPMLYPPMDEASNNLGGKGSSEMQDLLAGRKWQGCDIPCSILEAAEIFSKRMRAGRGMKQLWEERVRFLKYERGNGEYSARTSQAAAEQRKAEEQEDIQDVLDSELRRPLEAVEIFYKEALPHLQSVVLVLLRVLLQTVTTLVTQSGGPIDSPNGQHVPEQNGSFKVDGHVETGSKNKKSDAPSLQDVDVTRSQEIMCKAVSAILLLLLKWFKLSHVLKFEYFSQLLLDANYLQIILKQFTHQDLELVAKHRSERKSLNFFRFCRANSHHDPSAIADDSDSSSNEAVELQPPNTGTSDTEPDTDEPAPPPAPIVPITNFAWRTLFSTTNHLRTIQKLIHHKAHRQLLMVQYKSSATLKKCLKIPQPDLRLAALKCIKGQVPYCHRKWRQSNMRIITAIYLHCRPTLRDEWLAGIDVDQELSEALPQEQALRALTAWFHARRYPSKAVLEDEGEEEVDERDFFADELDRMDLGRGEGDEDGFQTDEEDGRWEGMQLEEWLNSRR